MTLSPVHITIALCIGVGLLVAFYLGMCYGFRHGILTAKEIHQDTMEEATYLVDRRTSRIPRKPRGGVPGGPFGTPAPPPKNP